MAPLSMFRWMSACVGGLLSSKSGTGRTAHAATGSSGAAAGGAGAAGAGLAGSKRR